MGRVVSDLSYIIDDARALVEAQGVAARCDVVAGDFFASVPAGGHAYSPRSVLHDWDDAQAVAILKNCHHAMQGQGKLLLVERVMPERAEQAPQVVFGDLEMLVMTPGGRERTEAEFRALIAAAGFKPRIACQHSPSSASSRECRCSRRKGGSTAFKNRRKPGWTRMHQHSHS
jgi:hypothetical protein